MDTICIYGRDGKVQKMILPDMRLDLAPQYPSEWFHSNTGSKPLINIPSSGLTDEELMKKLGDSWGTRTTLEEALEFCYTHIPKLMKAKVQENWESYGTVIARKGEEINPFSLLKVERESYDSKTSDGTQLDEKRVLERICTILAIYRAESASNAQGDYKTVVMARMEEVFKAHPFKMDRMDSTPILCKLGWAKSDNFKKMVAAVDMFMNKFRDHDLSPIRVATLTSRDKDCGGIVAMQDLSKILGLSVKESLTYAMDARIGEEIKRIIKSGEEVSLHDSYFHYFKELGLSQRSPYSSSLNPVLYNFTYAVGAFLGQPRSCNARLFSSDGWVNVSNLAAYVFYYMRDWVGAQAVFFDEKDQDKAKIANEDDDEEEIKDSYFILKKIQENKGEITKQMRTDIKGALGRLSNLRAGSIGKQIVDTFG